MITETGPRIFTEKGPRNETCADGSDRCSVRLGFLVMSGAVFEAPAFVAGLDDVAVVSQAIQ
jgi:hypothetical protein